MSARRKILRGAFDSRMPSFMIEAWLSSSETIRSVSPVNWRA